MSTSPVIDTNLFNYWVRGYGEKLFADDNKSLGYDDDKITEDFFHLLARPDRCRCCAQPR